MNHVSFWILTCLVECIVLKFQVKSDLVVYDDEISTFCIFSLAFLCYYAYISFSSQNEMLSFLQEPEDFLLGKLCFSFVNSNEANYEYDVEVILLRGKEFALLCNLFMIVFVINFYD